MTFTVVCLQASEITDHETLDASVVFVFGLMAFATFGASMLAGFYGHNDEAMKPLREKVAATWLVAFAAVVAPQLILGDELVSGKLQELLASLITLHALLGVTQSFLVVFRDEWTPRLLADEARHAAKKQVKQGKILRWHRLMGWIDRCLRHPGPSLRAWHSRAYWGWITYDFPGWSADRSLLCDDAEPRHAKADDHAVVAIGSCCQEAEGTEAEEAGGKVEDVAMAGKRGPGSL